MADVQLAEQSFPSTPSSGNALIFVDSSNSTLYHKDDAGKYRGRIANASVTSQSPGTSDAYITNSDLQIPSFGMQAGMTFYWQFAVAKGNFSTATPVYTIRIGTARTTADTSRLALTGPAQSANADVGVLTIMATVYTVGTSGTIRAIAYWNHQLTATGFANNVNGAIQGTSAGFDNSSTIAGQYVGISINAGASADWAISQTQAECAC